MNATLNIGWCGVDLFFVLSGFLIGGILLENTWATNYFKVFYIRRFFRIIPVYVAAILFFQPLFRLIGGRLMPLWVFATFSQTWIVGAHGSVYAISHLWSLSVEEWFYAFAPIVIRNFRDYIKMICIASFVICPFLRFLAWNQFGASGAYFLFPCRADSLLMGIFVATVYRSRHQRTIITGVSTLVFLLSAAVMAFLAPNWSDTHRIDFTLGISAFSMFFASFLMLILLNCCPAISLLLRNRHLTLTGKVSYAIYVVHVPLHELGSIFGLIIGGVAATFLSLAATFVIAHYSWEFLESKMISMGQRWRFTHLEGKNHLYSTT